jgi:predicted nucleic acid-binding protein
LTEDLIVADTGPLIGLAIAGRLGILSTLFARVLIPRGVLDELQLEASRPGSRAFSNAREEGWIATEDVPDTADVARLSELLDRGKAEAIVLAQSKDARLLIEERKGRAVACIRGITVVGTGGVLLKAKRRRVIDRIEPVLDDLASHGYRLSEDLRRELLILAGEA